MTTKMLGLLAIITIALSVVGGFLVPGIKGPFIEWKQEANDYLNDKYIVANCKQKVVEMENTRKKILNSIYNLKVQRKNVEYKIYTYEHKKKQLEQIMSNSVADIEAFNYAKGNYTSVVENIKLLNQCSRDIENNILKLEKTAEVVKNEMLKMHNKVVHLKNKKEIVDTLTCVNDIMEDINGLNITGEGVDVGGSINRLEERYNEEQVRASVIEESQKPASTYDVTSTESAKEYLKSIGVVTN